MDIVSRIRQYMEAHELTSSQFADRAGIPRPTLSQLFNGRNKSNESAKKVSSEIIRKLHDAFPNLNIMWLLFGDGDMDTDANIEFSAPQISQKTSATTFQSSIVKDFNQQSLFDNELPENEPDNFFVPKSNSTTEFPSQPDIRPTQSSPESSATTVAFRPDKTKKVQNIMVFYDDNSFEIFKPAE